MVFGILMIAALAVDLTNASGFQRGLYGGGGRGNRETAMRERSGYSTNERGAKMRRQKGREGR